MDNSPHPNSSWPCFWETAPGLAPPQDQAMESEHLKQALLRTTLELESTRLVAQEELKKLEAQSLHLANLLQITTRERDEARQHCHTLLQRLSIPQPQPITPNNNPNLEESSNAATPASSSSSESSKVALPATETVVSEKGLPEKGRLVEAVMRAGPLLQTLLLAGPLPQWRHPPPAMQSFEIPPVSICVNSGNDEKKRKRERSPTNLNLNSSSSPESNQQQFGYFRA